MGTHCMIRWAVASLLIICAASDENSFTARFRLQRLDGVEGREGCFVMQVHSSWAPNGASRMKELLDVNFFNGNRFFRVRRAFVAQWGINGDPAVSQQWISQRITDDPVLQSNIKGTVSYASTGSSNSRSTQMFINLWDNDPYLTGNFAPFAEVVHGMEVVDRVFKVGEGVDQARIFSEGNAYLESNYPRLTYITSAEIIEWDGFTEPCVNGSALGRTEGAATRVSTGAATRVSTGAATTAAPAPVLTPPPTPPPTTPPPAPTHPPPTTAPPGSGGDGTGGTEGAGGGGTEGGGDNQRPIDFGGAPDDEGSSSGGGGGDGMLYGIGGGAAGVVCVGGAAAYLWLRHRHPAPVPLSSGTPFTLDLPPGPNGLRLSQADLVEVAAPKPGMRLSADDILP